MNIMSEFMGLIYGRYDAKRRVWLCARWHEPNNRMLPHGPDLNAFAKASTEALKPHKLTDTMAFMFETRYPQHLTAYAASLARTATRL